MVTERTLYRKLFKKLKRRKYRNCSHCHKCRASLRVSVGDEYCNEGKVNDCIHKICNACKKIDFIFWMPKGKPVITDNPFSKLTLEWLGGGTGIRMSCPSQDGSGERPLA